ncbi:hypothetical protein [Brevibacillus agri]|uniref:hypothetical protein n=1 Tax=Brevibacillus agri TaxID=51101 RepID=UPI00286FF40D|nr:hypothetical protein [Brevibacillus agri]MDR9503837.1 hypothetical protein [Brevibacillus agri]
MEKNISIVIGFLVGLVFVNYEIDYNFLFDLGIKPEPVRLAVKLIGLLSTLICGLTLIFDAWRAMRSS